MKLLVGLGNPGAKYEQTRHNVGFMFLDYLKQQHKLDKQVQTLKPETYMNRSGIAVSRELSFYKLQPADLMVVHDDLDLKLGEFKIQFGKGPKLHNGVDSVERVLGTKEFWRVRVGIDNRVPDNRVSGESYVLQNFTPEELLVLQTKIFPILTPGVGQIVNTT